MRMYKIKASDSNSKTLFSSLILSSVLINCVMVPFAEIRDTVLLKTHKCSKKIELFNFSK